MSGDKMSKRKTVPSTRSKTAPTVKKPVKKTAKKTARKKTARKKTRKASKKKSTKKKAAKKTTKKVVKKAKKKAAKKVTKKAAKKTTKKATKKSTRPETGKKADAPKGSASPSAPPRREITLEEALRQDLLTAPPVPPMSATPSEVSAAVAAVLELPAQVVTPEVDDELGREIEAQIASGALADRSSTEELELDPSRADEWDFDSIDWAETAERAPLTAQQERPEDQLLRAAEQGDLMAIRSLLVEGVDATVRDLRPATAGWTAVMLAARNGRGDAVRMLLEAGVDPDATDDPADEHFGLVQFQGQRGGLDNAQVDLRLGRTACHLASALGHSDVVRNLIEFGCDVNVSDHGERTPLMLAVRGGFLALARLLVQVGASVNARDLEHSSVLSIAAGAGNAELVRLMLAAGAEVDAQDGLCCTPLMGAVAGAHWDAMRVLLEAGANVALQDIDGHGLLCFAIHAVDRSEPGRDIARVRPLSEEWVIRIVHQLLEAGADDRADGTGVCPSQRAEEQGMVDVAEHLRLWTDAARAA